MIKHFQALSQLTLTEAIPRPENIQIFGFRTFEKIDCIVVPIVNPNDDRVINTMYFYYSDSKKWLKMSATIGNIKAHIKIKHQNFIEVEPKEILNPADRNRIVKQFIITNGHPFSIVDKPLFAQLFPGIGTRKSIALLCSNVAKKIRIAIKLD